MSFRWSEIFHLANLYLFFAFIKYAHSYRFSQDEIDNAWQKMVKRERFFIPLNKQLGCWPQNVIPYTIKSGFTPEQIQHIYRHIYQIQNRTCVRWVENDMMSGVKKHVEFKHIVKDPLRCHIREFVAGKSGFRIITTISLGDDCFPRESVIHEMLHALGFLHEHQRIDRDCYVLVKEERARGDIAYKIIYDDDVFEKWPYDKRSITHYTRMTFALRDKDEPFWGLLWRYRLGDSYGWWGATGDRYGKLTCLDAYKINYRFCGAPDFCATRPELCQQIEEEEKEEGCKDLYVDIAKGTAKPSKQ